MPEKLGLGAGKARAGGGIPREASPAGGRLRACLFALALGLAALGLAACGKKPPLTPPQGPPAKSIGAIDWVLMPQGVKIGVMADPDLNTGPVGGGPAALMVCVYQLSDPGWFASNMKSSQGLSALAACPPAPASGPDAAGAVPVKGLVSAERYFFQPGERRDLLIDRQPGAQFVGVAGGFMTLPAQGGAAYLPVPVYHKKKLIFADTYEPMELRAWLILRSQLLAFYPKSEDSYDLTVDDVNPDGTLKKPKKGSKDIEPPPAYLPCPAAWRLKPGEVLVCPGAEGAAPTAPVPAPAAAPQGKGPAGAAPQAVPAQAPPGAAPGQSSQAPPGAAPQAAPAQAQPGAAPGQSSQAPPGAAPQAAPAQAQPGATPGQSSQAPPGAAPQAAPAQAPPGAAPGQSSQAPPGAAPQAAPAQAQPGAAPGQSSQAPPPRQLQPYPVTGQAAAPASAAPGQLPPPPQGKAPPSAAGQIQAQAAPGQAQGALPPDQPSHAHNLPSAPVTASRSTPPPRGAASAPPPAAVLGEGAAGQAAPGAPPGAPSGAASSGGGGIEGVLPSLKEAAEAAQAASAAAQATKAASGALSQ